MRLSNTGPQHHSEARLLNKRCCGGLEHQPESPATGSTSSTSASSPADNALTTTRAQWNNEQQAKNKTTHLQEDAVVCLERVLAPQMLEEAHRHPASALHGVRLVGAHDAHDSSTRTHGAPPPLTECFGRHQMTSECMRSHQGIITICTRPCFTATTRCVCTHCLERRVLQRSMHEHGQRGRSVEHRDCVQALLQDGIESLLKGRSIFCVWTDTPAASSDSSTSSSSSSSSNNNNGPDYQSSRLLHAVHGHSTQWIYTQR
jgi:hypothetical protein